MFFKAKKISSCEKGASAVIVAAALPFMIASLALGVEVGSWYLDLRKMQTIADAAAISAAYVIAAEGSYDEAEDAVDEIITKNGLNPDELEIVLNIPPEAGEYEGDDNAVEVYISRSQELLFMSFFALEQKKATARSTAKVRMVPGDAVACVLALDEHACGAITVQGSALSILDGCMVAVNSDCATALNAVGGGVIEAPTAVIVGGYDTSDAANFVFEEEPITGAEPTADPYSDVETPEFSGCDYNNFKVNAHQVRTLNPGVYCGGIDFGAHSVTTLSAGTYIIDRGTFDVNGSAKVISDGATIILTSSTGSNYADIKINGGAKINMKAPDSGDFSGVIFYKDRKAPPTIEKMNGGADTVFEGALYFPSATLEFTGGASTGGVCTQIIAMKITFTGNALTNNQCEGTGISEATPPIVGKVKLVE